MATDSQLEVPVGLVQNGAEAEPQVAVRGVRFSLFEGRDCLVAMQQALELVGSSEELSRDC